MIGKPEWFARRKYGGWGFHPKTWQGWVYIVIVLIPFFAFNLVSVWSELFRIIVTILWLGFLLIDGLHIMMNLDRDEREYKIEAVSERNVAWTMMIVLALGILYQIISSALTQVIRIDWFLVVALVAGMMVKTVSNIYYDKKGI